MDYMTVANSPFIYIVSGLIVTYVVLLCVIYLRNGLKRARALGIGSDTLRRTIRTAATFSVAPSLPIVVALIAMMGIMGLPYPWMRLSIIGSFQYELTTAKIGASAMGVEQLSTASSPQVFANSIWIMSLGIIWGMLMSVLFMKKFSHGLDQAKKKDQTKLQLIITALYFGMLSVFVGPPIVQGGIGLLTLLVSAGLFFLLTKLLQHRPRSVWTDFIFTFSMVGGMIFAVAYQWLF